MNINIGEVIKRCRLNRELTQAELAEKLNITPQAVSRWEMGVSYPDIAMIPDISNALFVTADELLGIGFFSTANNGLNRDPGGIADVLNQSQADSIFEYVPTAVSGESKRVLVTDDSDFMRMMLEDILTKQEYTVLQAGNGRECLKIMDREAVDVCVLDIGMPEMDGIETLKKIKEVYPELRVVMLSALSSKANVELTLKLGADAFVVKPFQADLLIERVG